MRVFEIKLIGRDPGPIFCSEDDVLGIIGEILSRVSQMDEGELVTIMFIDDE